MSLSTEMPQPATRVQVVDIMKGIAIVLVVFGHVAQGTYHRGISTGSTLQQIDIFIYRFHMPLFFFVSGLFVKRSIEKRTASGFLADKAKVILYPYLLWTTFGQLLAPVAARFRTVGTISWKDFGIGILTGDANWFLLSLFLCLVLALLTSRIPDWLRVFFAVAAGCLLPRTHTAFIDRPETMMPYLAAGMWIGPAFRAISQVRRITALLAAITFFLCIVFYTPSTFADSLFAGVAGILGTAFLAQAIDGTAFGNFWSALGQASLVIYLLHPYAQGASRLLVSHLVHSNIVWLQLLIPTFAAVMLPFLLWLLEQRVPSLGWLFQWKSRETLSS